VIAASITQSAHTRLDHVLLILGNLFCIYSDHKLDPQSHISILGSLETRWAKADQDVFILAVFLNPYIHQQAFNHMALTHAKLYDMAVQVLKRIFSETANLDFLTAFKSYYEGSGDFSDEDMGLKLMKQMYKAKMGWKAVYEFCHRYADNSLIARKRTLISLQSGSASTTAYCYETSENK
jgi:hypothetical protein